jgi:Tfp pilus assembly protein PilF
MSLLLQALQKAAKNRESTAPAAEAPAAPSPPERTETGFPTALSLETESEDRDSEPELALEEDLFEPEEAPPSSTAERFEPYATPAASSVQAASIVRAGHTRTAGWTDWVSDHPVHTFAAAAGVFMVFYGAYVYLQLFHPALLRGDLLSSAPLAAKTPPPPAQPITPPPAPPPGDAAAASADSPGAAAQAATAPPSPPSTPSAGAAVTIPPASEPPAPSASDPVVPPVARQAAPKAGDTRVDLAPQPVVSKPRRSRRSADSSLASAPPRESIAEQIATSPAGPGPAPLPSSIAQAYQALQDGQLDQAESLYRSAAQSDPQNVDAMLGLATIAQQRGAAQQAIGFYERALELEPRNAVAQAGLIAIIGQADPQMSETRLKQLIAREPSPFLYFSLGNLYARQTLWAPAQAAYFQAFQMQPDNADYAYNLAIGLEHLSQPKLALTYYRKALELSFQKGRANFDQNRVIARIGQLSARVD